MTFKKGDKVVLRKDSKFRFVADPDNQQLGNHVGTIVDTANSIPYPILVKWFDRIERTNGYDEEDLAPAKQHYIQQFKQLYGQKA